MFAFDFPKILFKALLSGQRVHRGLHTISISYLACKQSRSYRSPASPILIFKFCIIIGQAALHLGQANFIVEITPHNTCLSTKQSVLPAWKTNSILFFFLHLFLITCACLCVGMRTREYGTQGGQKRMSDLLELDLLSLVVSCLTGMRGLNSGPTQRPRCLSLLSHLSSPVH